MTQSINFQDNIPSDFAKQNIQITVTLTPDLRLAQALKQAGIKKSSKISRLSIVGTLTDEDFAYIRDHLYDHLQELDLGSALLKDNKLSGNFFLFSNFTSLVLPESLVEIEYSAFSGCESLTSFHVHPNNPAYSSENGILFDKNKTKLIIFPETIQGDYLIPDSVNIIEDRAFEDCKGLTSVVIPNSVTEIGFCAFHGCIGLTSIVIPDSVIKIRKSAFYNCTALASITISLSVTEIEPYSFFNCPACFDIHPDNPAYSSDNGIWFDKHKTVLFKYNQNLRGDYVIPDTVVEIGERAFQDCDGLKSVIIPESVTKIGKVAFCGCTALTSIIIPASVVELGEWTFAQCTALTSIAVHPDNPVFSSEDGILFNKLKTKLIDYPLRRQGDCIIPDSVIMIGERAFGNCAGLTSVFIPCSVEKIDDCAFIRCSGLTSIVIPDSVTEIGNGAFAECKMLSTVVISNSLKTINDAVFHDCPRLKSVNIPDSVMLIGEDAFLHCNLTSVYIPKSVDYIDNWAFDKKVFFTVHPDNPDYTSENGKLKRK